MHPLPLPRHADARLVGVGERGGGERGGERGLDGRQGGVRRRPGRGEGVARRAGPEQVRQRLADARVREQLVVAQVDAQHSSRGPYCTGAAAWSGNAAVVGAWQRGQHTVAAWCSVTTSARGGRSTTCRRATATASAPPAPRRTARTRRGGAPPSGPASRPWQGCARDAPAARRAACRWGCAGCAAAYTARHSLAGDGCSGCAHPPAPPARRHARRQHRHLRGLLRQRGEDRVRATGI